MRQTRQILGAVCQVTVCAPLFGFGGIMKTEKQVKTEPTSPQARPKRKYRSRARPRSPETVIRAKKQRRSKANDRERNRMHTISEALEQLRSNLPCLPDDEKLTKIETLRMAHNYILTLTEILKMDEQQIQSVTKMDPFSNHFPPPQVSDSQDQVWERNEQFTDNQWTLNNNSYCNMQNNCSEFL